MKTAEICAGYGGLFRAMQLAGWPVELSWVAEVDPDASKVLAAHHPGVPNIGDLTTADWGAVNEVDILAGGIPCQGWSLAGLQQGSRDARDLWPVRKLEDDGTPRRGAVDAVRSLRPKVFVLENVASLVTAEKGVPFGTILADLVRIGYVVAWVTLGACRVGACHHRHRVFVVATRSDCVPGDVRPVGVPTAFLATSGRWAATDAPLFGDAGPVKWPTAGVVVDGHVWPLSVDVCGASSPVLPTPTATPYGNNQSPSAGAAVRPSLDGVVRMLPTPTTSDVNGPGVSSTGGFDLRTAVSMLPTPTARDATRGAGWGDQSGRPLSEVIALLPAASDARGVGALLPTPRASDAAKGGPNQRGSSGDLALPAAVQPARFGVYEAAVRRHERVFAMPAPEPTEPGRLGKPRLSASFVEWMQGLPPGFLTGHLGRNAAIARAGNGVVPQQAAYALRLLAPYLPSALSLEGVAA